MKKVLYFVGLLVISATAVVLSLYMHELSHMLMAVLCGGKLHEASIAMFSSSFVGAEINPEYISLVAFASLCLPIIPVFLSFIRFKSDRIVLAHHTFWTMLVVAPLINNLFNLIVFFLVKVQNRGEWDLLLAYDYSTVSPYIWIIGSVICLIVSSFLLVYNIRQSADKFLKL